MDNEPAQEALFQIEGPDEDGSVWAYSPAGREVWCQNVGPVDKVRVVLAEFLASMEQDEGSR